MKICFKRVRDTNIATHRKFYTAIFQFVICLCSKLRHWLRSIASTSTLKAYLSSINDEVPTRFLIAYPYNDLYIFHSVPVIDYSE